MYHRLLILLLIIPPFLFSGSKQGRVWQISSLSIDGELVFDGDVSTTIHYLAPRLSNTNAESSDRNYAETLIKTTYLTIKNARLTLSKHTFQHSQIHVFDTPVFLAGMKPITYTSSGDTIIVHKDDLITGTFVLTKSGKQHLTGQFTSPDITITYSQTK